MAVTCAQCGELTYADDVCEHCGVAHTPPVAHMEVTQQAAAHIPTPQGQLRITKRAQDAQASHESQQWEFVVDGKQISIGRAPSCDLALESDLLVSRRHAIILPRNGMHVVLDLGSSNGTWVNDTLISEETPLRVGDAIRIGEYELVYNTVSAVLDAPAAPLMEADSTVPAPHEAAAEHDASADATRGADDVTANRDQEGEYLPGELQGERSTSVASHHDAASYTGELREALSDIQRTVAELVGKYGTPSADGLALDELLRVVRDAAEHPRDLDYVTSLAMNARSIAFALDAYQALYAPQGLLDSLMMLTKRLEQMLG